MSSSNQTLESIKADFDNIALLPDGWGHNDAYLPYLLGLVPESCETALEIGCGTGRFARLLATRSRNVMAIDLSQEMIRGARDRSRAEPNIQYLTGDVMSYKFEESQFDYVASLTALHHLEGEVILEKVARLLKPGGVFICLDLYQRADVMDLLVDCLAIPVSYILRFLKTGRIREPQEVREAYARHGKTDRYLTLAQIRQVADRVLPGAQIRRRILWRYTLYWKKPPTVTFEKTT